MPNEIKDHWLINDAKTLRDIPHFRITDSLNCRFAGAVKTLVSLYDAEQLKKELNELVAAHDEATKIAQRRMEGGEA